MRLCSCMLARSRRIPLPTPEPVSYTHLNYFAKYQQVRGQVFGDSYLDDEGMFTALEANVKTYGESLTGTEETLSYSGEPVVAYLSRFLFSSPSSSLMTRRVISSRSLLEAVNPTNGPVSYTHLSFISPITMSFSFLSLRIRESFKAFTLSLIHI